MYQKKKTNRFTQYSFGNTGLLEAVKNNEIKKVRIRLVKGADVNFVGPDGKTPLHIASWNGNTEIVKLLVAKGANVNAVDNEGWTPLHRASRNGHTEIVKLLLAAGANVNAVDEDEYTPLHPASRHGHIEVVKLLLAAPGIDINAVDKDDNEAWTPLHWAVANRNTEIVKLLLAAGAKTSVLDNEERTALDLAREDSEDIEIANAIIEESMNRSKKRILAENIEKGRGIPTGLISQYLAFGRTKGRATIKRPVSKKKSMANKMGLAKIKKTARKLGTKQIAVRKKMVGKKKKMKKYSFGNTGLLLATKNNNLSKVRSLIDKGANVNFVGPDGKTPLHFAADNRNIEMVKLLLAKGANVNAADSTGYTPLHFAAVVGDTEVVKLLLAAPGIDVNAANSTGKTTLHFAAVVGNTEVVKLLLAAPGIDVNAANSAGKTPLQSAAGQGRTEVVKLLLTAGAKISVRDIEGRTALDLARRNGRTEVANSIIAEDMIRLENRNKAGRIEKGRGIPPGLISQYLAFGRTKRRATIKRPVSKKKSVANKMGLAKIKKTAQKLGIRVTTTRNGKRVYKKVPALLIMKREKIVKIVKSPSTGKKYMAIVQNLVTKKTRKIHFGATGYQQYKDSTSIKIYRSKNHYDKNRRRRYFLRHSGVSGKRQALSKEWKKSKGLFNAKILSHYYLW